jgi:hypothetical protein
LLARPDATFVAGFKAWLELGYCVRKGEHAIRIFAPMTVNHDSSEKRILFFSPPILNQTCLGTLPVIVNRKRIALWPGSAVVPNMHGQPPSMTVMPRSRP